MYLDSSTNSHRSVVAHIQIRSQLSTTVTSLAHTVNKAIRADVAVGRIITSTSSRTEDDDTTMRGRGNNRACRIACGYCQLNPRAAVNYECRKGCRCRTSVEEC